MIPKVIHYCWFGRNPLPKSAVRCIESWKSFFPDYEIKEWNEDNFDVDCIPYTSEAYKAKKYAFVSDYARFKILYDEGGLYFDTDVEVIRSMNDIIAQGPFMGIESVEKKTGATTIGVAPGLGLGVNPGLGLIKKLLERYSKLHFADSEGNMNLTTVVYHTTDELLKNGLKPTNEIQECCGITIYPTDYFNPKGTINGKTTITANTRSIHHYDNSWHTPYEQLKMKIVHIIGKRLTRIVVSIKHALNL